MLDFSRRLLDDTRARLSMEQTMHKIISTRPIFRVNGGVIMTWEQIK